MGKVQRIDQHASFDAMFTFCLLNIHDAYHGIPLRQEGCIIPGRAGHLDQLSPPSTVTETCESWIQRIYADLETIALYVLVTQRGPGAHGLNPAAPAKHCRADFG
jgi:hypothetical protein